MLTLNLLPKQQKENLDYEIYRRMAGFFGFWFSTVVFVFGILILPAFFFVSFQQSDAERTVALEEEAVKASRVSEIENKINSINGFLSAIISREEKKRVVSEFYGNILSKAPSGVSVSIVKYEPSKNRATVAGEALTRSNLIKFIDLLKADKNIKSVSSPVSNIIQEENVNFKLSIEIQP
ncbi:MAG: hypothetical protein Q7S66_05840 [bacterium]|nr:hypothetical protein [bacterium]